MLASVGLPAELAGALDDESLDEAIRAETKAVGKQEDWHGGSRRTAK